VAERLPPGAYDSETIKLPHLPNGLEPNGIHIPDATGERLQTPEATNGSYLASSLGADSTLRNGPLGPPRSPRETYMLSENCRQTQDDQLNVNLPGSGGLQPCSSNVSDASDARDSAVSQDTQNGVRSRSPIPEGNNNQVEAEWIEQYEPGVYITLVALRDGTRDLKRVRFR